MSLVNDMLRDLDRRQRATGPAARINKVFAPRKPEPVRKANLTVVTLAFASVALGFGGGYFLFKEAGLVQAMVARVAGLTAPQVNANEIVHPTEAQLERAQQDVVAADIVVPDPLASANTLSVIDEGGKGGGFALRITAQQALAFTTLLRTDSSFALRIEGVSGLTHQQINTRGISLLQSDGGVVVEYSAQAATDFQLYEDAATPGFDLVLTGKPRYPEQVALSPSSPAATASEYADWYASGSAHAPAKPPVNVASAWPGPTTVRQAMPAHQSKPGQRQTTPVRVARELPLEQRDARNSRQAIALVQTGQFNEAYAGLMNFISTYPQAHLSRETLATVLVAQTEYGQAESVIDEGLALVPNYAPFKKIKARLLIQQNQQLGALELLRNVPPEVASDTEYFELLAMVAQHTGDYTTAISTYQNLLRTDGNQGRWWAGMGISLESLARTADALSSYQAAINTPALDRDLRQFAENKIRTLSSQL